MEEVIREFYDNYISSGEYEKRYPYPNPHVLNIILKILPRGRVVLDAGCGNGRYLIPLAMEGYKIIGIDISGRMVSNLYSRIKSNNVSADVVLGDIRDLPIKNECIDAVICLFGVLSHIQGSSNRDKALSEFYRVLKPQGTLIVSVPNKYRRFFKEQILSKLNSHLADGILYKRNFGSISFYHLYSATELYRVLSQNNFKEITIIGESLITESFSIKSKCKLLKSIERVFLRSRISRFISYNLLAIAKKEG